MKCAISDRRASNTARMKADQLNSCEAFGSLLRYSCGLLTAKDERRKELADPSLPPRRGDDLLDQPGCAPRLSECLLEAALGNDLHS